MKLLDKTVKDIMNEFGAGNHKPGSGSAAAFQGMVSSKLLSTVISLCADEKRRHRYSSCINTLLYFQEDLENRIYPRLTVLFQMDSEQFDRTIKLRKARIKENDEIKKNQYRRQALEELKISIDIPFEIANLCKEIAYIGIYVFDNGFRSARGDSQVGMSGAVSALSGCISIIRLNVLSYFSDEFDYTKKVVKDVDELYKEYTSLSKEADYRIEILNIEFKEKVPLFEGINKIISKYKGNPNINVENCVRELQNLIWINRKVIWKKSIPSEKLDILDPEIVLRKILGYDFFNSSEYGISDENENIVEVAGIIDQQSKIVAVSNKYSDTVQRFTAAHELGHAILHDQEILHRDLIPIHSDGQREIKSKNEVQADKFSTYFLMPKNLVIEEFQNIYSTTLFEINNETAFMLGGKTVREIKNESKNLISFSRKLASLDYFDNKFFEPLTKKFRVSTQAMAIRLIELGLVKY